MADYLYGKLNKELELAEYTGKESDTASVEIDNNKHTIKVDIKNFPTISGSDKGKVLVVGDNGIEFVDIATLINNI